jgi:hypothetical protein
LKKLPGFAGNTNVMAVTEKTGTRAACSTPGMLRGSEKYAKLLREINQYIQRLRSNFGRSIAGAAISG